ncbi:MAG: ABC transporter permease [Anaerolineae bacterium]|nr:ABC transporter permease [Anaerolineae bacterium]
MRFGVLLRKELLELWRTYKMLAMGLVFLLFGLLSPAMAKLTPELLKMVGTSQPGVVIQIPPPTTVDALDQYLKNLTQLCTLVLILVAMGVVARERERGTAVLTLSKPVGRGAFLAAKFASLAALLAGSLVVSAAFCYLYTVLLFGSLDAWLFLQANLLLAEYLLVILALTFLGSTLLRSQLAAGGLAFGLWMATGILGALPRIGKVMPGELVGWAAALSRGLVQTAWPAVWGGLALIVLCLAVSWLSFRGQEL